MKKLSKDLSAVASALKQSEALVVGKAARVRRKVCVCVYVCLCAKPPPTSGTREVSGRPWTAFFPRVVEGGEGWIIWRLELFA